MRRVNAMSNPQLDQFTSALWWKVLPWMILAGAAGLLGGLLKKWLDRRVSGFGARRRDKAKRTSTEV